MATSSARCLDAVCPDCLAEISFDVWVIVDTAERPELLDLLREGELFRIACPDCGADLGECDAPLVLYRPDRDPAVLFVPAEETTPEEDHADAGALLSELRDRLGARWCADWLRPLNTVGRQRARFVLADEAADMHPMQVGALFDAAQQLTRTETWDGVRRIIDDHPGLLGPLADRMLAWMAAVHPRPRAREFIQRDRTVLDRCRQVGPDRALAECAAQDRSGKWPPHVVAALTGFTAPQTWPESREVLQAHRDVLLDPAVDEVLAESLPELAGNPEVADYIEQHRAVLRHARESGVDAAFAGLPGPKTSTGVPAGTGASLEAAGERERALLHRAIESDPGGSIARAARLLAESGQTPGHAQRAELLDRVRRLLDQETFPYLYATVTLTMAESLVDQPGGDGAESALALCRQVEPDIDRDRTPQLWWILHAHLGEAYRKRTAGDPADNIERAIAHAEQSLAARPDGTDRTGWAGVMHNLGVAHLERVLGDRADNIEIAIRCLHRALEVRTRDAHPSRWADSQVSLANAYADRVHGSGAENLETAIAGYVRALEVLRPEEQPISWAFAMTGLGTVHRARVLGEPGENLARAVRCFEEILEALSAEEHPATWAMARHNLGNALSSSGRDDDCDLRRAVTCYDQALRVHQRDRDPLRWATTQLNLGRTLGRLGGDDNVRRAVAALEHAAEVFTREGLPRQWGAVQSALAGVLHDSAAPAGRVAFHLREALAVYTADAFPTEHRMLAGQLGGIHFAAGEWAAAHAAYDTAIRAADALYQVAATETGQHAELSEAGNVVANEAYCLARLGRFAAAVERLEGGRARALAEATAQDRAGLAAVTPEDRRAFETARDRVRTLIAGARAADQDRVALHEQVAVLGAARRELTAVVERIRRYVPEFLAAGMDFGAIVSAAAEPLVYLTVTDRGGLALIVPPRAAQLSAAHCVWLDACLTGDVWRLLSGYLPAQFSGDAGELQEGLSRVLPDLTARLDGPVVRRLAELGHRRATLIPGGRLGLLPLHAAMLDECTVTYAPSARVVAAAGALAAERSGRRSSMLGVGDPGPGSRPLPFARLEVAGLASILPEPSGTFLLGERATPGAVLAALPDTTHLHVACHGVYRFDRPVESGIQLSHDRWLTLAMLLDGVRLPAARLVVLSACQTAMAGLDQVPDEAIGLPAGFLRAGAPAVLGSLWPVEDLSTCLLIRRFYQRHLGSGEDPATALRHAQLWLRDADGRELADACGELLGDAGHDATVRLHRAIRHLRAVPGGRPYAHPFYWAAFTFSGAGGTVAVGSPNAV